MEKQIDELYVTDTVLDRISITGDEHEDDSSNEEGKTHDCCVTVMEQDYKFIQIKENRIVTKIFHPGLSNIKVNDKLLELNGESLTSVSGAEFIQRFKTCLLEEGYFTMTIQRNGDQMPVEHISIRCTIDLRPTISNETTMAIQTTVLPGQQKFWTIVDNYLKLDIVLNLRQFANKCIFKLYQSDRENYYISWKDQKYLCAVNSEDPQLLFKDGNLRQAPDSRAEFRMRRNTQGTAFESVYFTNYYIHYDENGDVTLKRSLLGRHPPALYRFNLRYLPNRRRRSCTCTIL